MIAAHMIDDNLDLSYDNGWINFLFTESDEYTKSASKANFLRKHINTQLINYTLQFINPYSYHNTYP